MSVLRSAYRQLLRLGHDLSHRYTDPNDLCFSIFGILVTRQDFINAGYGSTYATILRTCFSRPSIDGNKNDALPLRMSASFELMRRLQDLKASSVAYRIREVRASLEEDKKAEDAEASTSTTASATSAAATAATASVPDATSTTAEQATEGSPTVAEAPHSAMPAKSSGSDAKLKARTLEEEGVTLAVGNIFMELQSHRRVQKFRRHCVLCTPISSNFPPYRFLVPPEPAYLLATREQFHLYSATDVLLCLSASSILQEHYHTLADDSSTTSTSVAAETTATGESKGRRRKELEKPVTPPLEPRGFPRTQAEFASLLSMIPSRTVTSTDMLEIEISTEYVCSNPAYQLPAVASSSSSAAEAGGEAGGSTSPFRFNGNFASDAQDSGVAAAQDREKAHLFVYYVHLRNRGPRRNTKGWHAQVLSHHFVVVDAEAGQVVEMARPGLLGNFPVLAPGASHSYEGGTTLSGSEGVLRGSIQVNLYNDAGEMVTLDAAIAPTRLSVAVTTAEPFTSPREAKSELVERRSASNL